MIDGIDVAKQLDQTPKLIQNPATNFQPDIYVYILVFNILVFMLSLFLVFLFTRREYRPAFFTAEMILNTWLHSRIASHGCSVNHDGMLGAQVTGSPISEMVENQTMNTLSKEGERKTP